MGPQAVRALVTAHFPTRTTTRAGHPRAKATLLRDILNNSRMAKVRLLQVRDTRHRAKATLLKARDIRHKATLNNSRTAKVRLPQ